MREPDRFCYAPNWLKRINKQQVYNIFQWDFPNEKNIEENDLQMT